MNERIIERDSPWLTIDEAARYLRISAGTVRNWIYAKRVPYIKRGRIVRLHREALDAWLHGQETEVRSMVQNNR